METHPYWIVILGRGAAVAHTGSMAASAAREEDLLCRHTPRRTTRHSYGLERHNGQALGHPQDGVQGAQRCRDNSRRHS